MSDTQPEPALVSDRFRAQCEAIVQSLGLNQHGPIDSITALPGGVSSDIALVRIGNAQICIKCALDQLKVDAPWFAPVRRNRAEYRWLEFAKQVVPQAIPDLFGIDETSNGFAMQYLTPVDAWNYKTGLLAGKPDEGQASEVGRIVAQIQAASTKSGFDPTALTNPKDFHALRIEPYLLYAATQHLEVADALNELARQLDSARLTLIHGDVSPKNTLVGSAGPVLLDAECATIGDPAFDIAFFTNHLILKAFHMPSRASMLIRAMQDCIATYREYVSWEKPETVCLRIGALIPALMLARVDGKSPVEYLNPATQQQVRDLALTMLTNRLNDTNAIAAEVTRSIEQSSRDEHQ